MNDWDHLRFVLAIGRAGTLAGAARRLAVDQTTLARRLKAAEAALGTRLFDRIDGRFVPTAAGVAAIGRADAMANELAALTASLGGRDTALAGTVRITAVPILANRLLVPALSQLHAQAPGLRVSLIAEARDLDLARREADIALRLARPRSGTMLARRIGRVAYAVYAARGRAAATLPWVGYDDSVAHLPQARWIKAARGAVGALAVSDAETLVQALRAGLGRSLLPRFVGDADAALRRLGGASVLTRELWLLVDPGQRRLARIAAAIAWIERTIAVAGLR